MNEEELFHERELQIAAKRGIEAEFTDEWGEIDWEALENSSEWPQYQALRDVVLSSPDPENTIYEIEFWQNPNIGDDYKYKFPDEYIAEHPDARLGNIDVALVNKWIITGHYTSEEMSDVEKMKRVNVQNQLEYLDDYQYDFDTYSYMYGVAELKAQQQSLYGILSTLESTGYDTSSGDIYDEKAYQKYIKYRDAYESCTAALEERQTEYDDAQRELNSIQSQRRTIAKDVDISNQQFEFTPEELELLDKYRIHTDYVNENILITTQSTNDEIIDAEYQLYLDAAEQLYVESHPQYQWSITEDNLLLMPEFQDWHGEQSLRQSIGMLQTMSLKMSL